ncbi:MAG: hypothetical protein ACHP7P_01000 [Terriglobales bacterium]
MKILSRISAFLLRTSRTVILLGSILLVTTICSASRISGTYVAHGTDFAEMLRLTQTDNGQVSGVLISVQLEAGGNITSRQTAVTGVTDADQLTLGNMAGTVRGNTIQLQWVDPKGNVATSAFVRSTPDDFKAYADQLKSKGRGIVLSTQLTEGAQRFRQTVQSAEKWIGNAELHADRIPRVKAAYEKIENQMRSLVAQERSEPYGSVARTQISVMVGQGDIAGGQTDIEVSQIWDFGIEEPGTGLYKDFTNWDGNCGSPDQLRGRGATPQSIEAWESGCKQALAGREKFIPIYKRIVEQGVQLKSFQSGAEARRKALVDEANRIDYAEAR